MLTLAVLLQLVLVPAHASCSGKGYDGNCMNGYALNPDGKTCRDVNECDPEEADNFEGDQPACEVCNNVCGSYSCSCNEGRILDYDGVTCYDSSCAIDTPFSITVGTESGEVTLPEALPNGETTEFECNVINPNSTSTFSLTCTKGNLEVYSNYCEASCQPGEWYQEGGCTATCGEGQQRWIRTINKGESDCAETEKFEVCATEPCPVDCKLSDWSEFGSCSGTCGCGVQIRTRTIEQEPVNGGEPCGEVEEWQECKHNEKCPKDAVCGEWVESSCSTTCGPGFITSTRERLGNAQGGGQECELTKQAPCFVEECPLLAEVRRGKKCNGTPVPAEYLEDVGAAVEGKPNCRHVDHVVFDCLAKAEKLSEDLEKGLGRVLFNFERFVLDGDAPDEHRCCFFLEHNMEEENTESDLEVWRYVSRHNITVPPPSYSWLSKIF